MAEHLPSMPEALGSDLSMSSKAREETRAVVTVPMKVVSDALLRAEPFLSGHSLHLVSF